MLLMKRKLFLTVLLSCLFFIPATARNVTVEEGLAALQNRFAEKDVDIYLLEDDSSRIWRFFVDAEPMKGWEHTAYLCRIPKQTTSPTNLFPIFQVSCKLPPAGTLIPLLVKNRYGERATEKPRVNKANVSAREQDVADRTYAVILSGGANKNANYERYWNDCSFVFQTLVNKYGIPHEHISVIMSDGIDPADDMHAIDGGYKSSPLDLDFDGVPDIRYAATKANVQQVLSGLSGSLKADDHLFFYVIDHGGSNDFDSQSYINLWGNETLQDYELADYLLPMINDSVTVNVVLGQCFSGGFIGELTEVGCVVAAASTGSEYSWACLDKPYDEFVYHWTSAINQATPDGTAVNSDADGNGQVSMAEAFAYVEMNDTASETPQYISTPVTVGQGLSFGHLVKSFDVYIRDNSADTGVEPNLTTDIIWDSPDVWIRNKPDGKEEHENPYYTTDHYSVPIYVRVHNRGKYMIPNGLYWVHTYWAEASTGINRATWKGRELYKNKVVTGGHLGSVDIDSILAGCDTIVRVNWALPDRLHNLMEEDGVKRHFCLLARIMDSPWDDGYNPADPYYFDVKGDRQIAQKNVTVMYLSDARKGTSVFVRNIYGDAHSYSLEIRPRTEADKRLFTKAKVSLEMSQPVFNAWDRGGRRAKNIAYVPAENPRRVEWLSSESRVENICLAGKEFDEVVLKLEPAAPNLVLLNSTFDLIQRDAAGNIVGGETFVLTSRIQLPLLNINSEPLSGGAYRLSAELPDEEPLAVHWRDASGSVIGTDRDVVVTPTLQNNEFSAVAVLPDGEAEGSIILTPENGFESVLPTSSVEDHIDITFRQEVESSRAAVCVSSLTKAESLLTQNLPAGISQIRLDLSALPAGVYVVSYMEDGKVMDSRKFTKK